MISNIKILEQFGLEKFREVTLDEVFLYQVHLYRCFFHIPCIGLTTFSLSDLLNSQKCLFWNQIILQKRLRYLKLIQSHRH
jgi:hypothetical protein